MSAPAVIIIILIKGDKCRFALLVCRSRCVLTAVHDSDKLAGAGALLKMFLWAFGTCLLENCTCYVLSTRHS